MTGALERALTSAVAAFDETGLRYAVVGGLAVGAWGVSRSTRDADFFAELPSDRQEALENALRARGFHVPAMKEELQTYGVFRSRSRDGVFVDIFDAVGPLGADLLAHRREVHVFDRKLWVTAPEELFLLKAFSERGRDYDDLVSLASVPGLNLDLSYIEDWARKLDQSIGGNEVSERVRKALVIARVGRG
jgi:hypothetical protein